MKKTIRRNQRGKAKAALALKRHLQNEEEKPQKSYPGEPCQNSCRSIACNKRRQAHSKQIQEDHADREPTEKQTWQNSLKEKFISKRNATIHKAIFISKIRPTTAIVIDKVEAIRLFTKRSNQTLSDAICLDDAITKTDWQS